jgi:hypothetical protein
MINKPILYLALLIGWLFCRSAFSQSRGPATNKPVFDVGIRLQKSIDLYAENGITVQYTHPKLANNRLYVGASYVTSRLGTALASNAIKQDNIVLFTGYYFRPNWTIQPFVKANVGYFKADYGLDLFNDLPQRSLLASPEIGLCYCPAFPLKISGSIGYNLLTGNGVLGPGTLYPVFVQTSITWNILKKPTPGQ